jgi:hypothetical protein
MDTSHFHSCMRLHYVVGASHLIRRVPCTDLHNKPDSNKPLPLPRSLCQQKALFRLQCSRLISCSLVGGYQHYGWICLFHLQGLKEYSEGLFDYVGRLHGRYSFRTKRGKCEREPGPFDKAYSTWFEYVVYDNHSYRISTLHTWIGCDCFQITNYANHNIAMSLDDILWRQGFWVFHQLKLWSEKWDWTYMPYMLIIFKPEYRKL